LKNFETIVRAVYPHCVTLSSNVQKVYRIVALHVTHEVALVLYALVLLFLGGQFAMCVACWQVLYFADKGGLREEFLKSWNDLVESYAEAMNKMDRELSAKEQDHLGPLEIFPALGALATSDDVQEREVARQKAFQIMKCIDPNKVLNASKGLGYVFVAVIGTLHSRTVRGVSLGAGVGNQVAEAALPVISDWVEARFKAQKEWVIVAIRTVCFTVGAIIGLMLIRVISAFRSAFFGGELLVQTMQTLAIKHRITVVSDKLRDPAILEGFAVSVAVIGFGVQVFAGFDLPFYLKLPLFPIYCVESFLSIAAMVFP